MIEHVKKYKALYFGAGSLPFADRAADNVATIMGWLLTLIHIPMPDPVSAAIKELLTMIIIGFVIGATTPEQVSLQQSFQDWLNTNYKK